VNNKINIKNNLNSPSSPENFRTQHTVHVSDFGQSQAISTAQHAVFDKYIKYTQSKCKARWTVNVT